MVKDSKVAAAFNRRAYPRYTYMNDVIIHDNTSVYLAKPFRSGKVAPDHHRKRDVRAGRSRVFALFGARRSLPPAFNAKGRVVNKRYVKDLRNVRSPIPYGIQFTSIESQAQEALRAHFETKVAA